MVRMGLEGISLSLFLCLSQMGRESGRKERLTEKREGAGVVEDGGTAYNLENTHKDLFRKYEKRSRRVCN